MEEIQGVFNKYLINFQERESIRKEIKNSHKSLKRRLRQIQQENQQYETLLIDYMLKHNLPGIRKDEFVLLCEQKSVPVTKHKKEEKIEEILRRNQCDPTHPMYHELKNLVIQSKSPDTIKHQIRCKRFQESS